MAIINNTYQFTFIHIAESAGSSMAHYYSALSNVNDIEIGCTEKGKAYLPIHTRFFPVSNHITSADLAEYMGGESVFRRYYSFAFVRNSYSRVIALFNFWKDWIPRIIREGSAPQNFKNLLNELDRHTEVDSFVRSDYWTGPDVDNVFHPQNHLTHSATGKQLVSDVFKMENIKESIDHINRKLHVEMEEFNLKLNASKPHTSSFLSPQSIDLISIRYHNDFVLFDYNLQPPKEIAGGGIHPNLGHQT